VYEYLEGRAVEQGPARLVLDTGGVAYELSVPLGVSFGGSGESAVRVYTHLVVREDAHKLFGFADRRQRELFRLLLAAKGVGPGLALTVLSGLPRRDLLEALAAGDTAPLLRVKGLGRKRADQMLLDLRERAARLLLLEDSSEDRDLLTPPGAARGRASAVIEDAVAALLSIGFSEKEARKNVEAAASRTGSDDLESLVRTALQK
jgi:Holliday junction DNA helicase RuvA